MKKTIILVSVFSLSIIACHKKAVPTFSTRSINIEEIANNNTPDIEAGKNTFTARCNRCHDLPDPSKYTAQRWDGILSIMTFRARLTKEETDNVAAYIKANCSK